MRIDKEGIAMKKILSSILLFILGIVVAICALIVACAMEPGIAKSVSDVAKSLNLHIEIKKAEDEELVAEAAEKAKEIVEATESELEGAEAGELIASADSAALVSSVTYTETKEKDYSAYLGDWSTSGIDKDIVSENGNENEPLVNEDIYEVDENGNPVTYYDNIDEMTGYSLPTRDVVKLEDQTAVQDALINVGMGYTGSGYDFDKTYYPYYHMLNDKCKNLYRQIYANALNQWNEFLPAVVATSSEWNNALLSVVYDHPELFWLDTKLYTEYEYGGKVVKVKIYFYEDALGDIESARDAFDARVQTIVTMVDAIEKTEEKEQFIHDYLAAKLTYRANDLDQSAYSAIVGDETVCAGYSKAFQYLMQRAGIPTYFCVGWGGGLVSGGMHGWNIVNLGKKYVNVDVTWDDQEPLIYEFYNKPDSDFHRHKRMFNSQYLPACK